MFPKPNFCFVSVETEETFEEDDRRRVGVIKQNGINSLIAKSKLKGDEKRKSLEKKEIGNDFCSMNDVLPKKFSSTTTASTVPVNTFSAFEPNNTYYICEENLDDGRYYVRAVNQKGINSLNAKSKLKGDEKRKSLEKEIGNDFCSMNDVLSKNFFITTTASIVPVKTFSAFYPNNTCFLCEETLDDERKVRVVKQKGINSLIAKSKFKGDDKWKTLENLKEIRIHELCRMNYVLVGKMPTRYYYYIPI